MSEREKTSGLCPHGREQAGCEACREEAIEQRLERSYIEGLAEPHPDFSRGKLANFEWPIELQGKGEYLEDEDAFRIKYPRGDIFLSYVILIHELGHPLQERQSVSVQQAVTPHERLLAEETDAWERGLARFQRANPELFAELVSKFQRYFPARQFEETYRWIRDNILRVVEAERVLIEGEETSQKEQRIDQLAEDLERAGFREFIEACKRYRVNEQINSEQAEGAIRRTLRALMKEEF